MLARALSAQGLRTAHIVFPVDDPGELPGPAPAIVQRRAWAGSPVGEARRVAQALVAADASTYVFRMSSPALGLVAAWCRARERGLVFASANDYDFTFERLRRGPMRSLYRFGVRRSHAVVVQTSRQVELARSAFPGLEAIEEIPSFAEPATVQSADPVAFLWAARVVDYKRPLAYLDLAAAVPEARFRMIAMETGETDPELRAELHRRGAELDNLELLEPRGREAVGRLMDEAVAVVNTSTLEGMPNMFLEAWARGVPALSLEFDPDGRIAEHGLGTVAGGSPGRLAEEARAMWKARSARAAEAEHARAYIARTHSLEAVGERWARVIEGVALR